jgi:hypothetical protein
MESVILVVLFAVIEVPEIEPGSVSTPASYMAAE